MSDATRIPEEYLERYATSYCNGDIDAAKEHAIVKAVIEEKQKK